MSTAHRSVEQNKPERKGIQLTRMLQHRTERNSTEQNKMGWSRSENCCLQMELVSLWLGSRVHDMLVRSSGYIVRIPQQGNGKMEAKRLLLNVTFSVLKPTRLTVYQASERVT